MTQPSPPPPLVPSASSSAPSPPPARLRQAVVAGFIFCAITLVVLNMPDHPDAMTPAAFLRLPLEVPALLAVLIMARDRLNRLLAFLLTLVCGVMLFLKLADIGTQAAFQRPFNPYLDVKMLGDGWNIASGNLGFLAACLSLLGIVLLLAGVLGLTFSAIRRLAPVGRMTGRRAGLSAGLLAVSALLLATTSLRPGTLPVTADAGRYLGARVTLGIAAARDLRLFEQQLADGEKAGRASAGNSQLFQAVAGRDVILVFVESYGRSAVEDPRYAPVTAPRLAAMEKELGRAGFQSASRWITSPTVGGLSWLAHGTFLSGLQIDSQARYDRLMASERPSLNRLFADAGWEAVAVMPAITMDWPEAAYYGYDRILAAKDLGYRGKPFNWITMPDQYTLSALQTMVRAKKPRKPAMVEMALISSHAPWTPVASMVDWDAIGDGSVFDAQATSGDPPAVVWANPERVRRQYIETIDYSLQALSSYIARHGEDAVFLVIGDHQPAAIVTGPDASRAVPFSVISRDGALIDRFQAAGFDAGLTPKQEVEQPMSGLYNQLIDLLR
ncbi:hypothetical protein J2858_003571 [Neorhizobium galegae]|uniref:sulfatase n=1 Tax=Neorhizobium galegae TaxID=399 RepID=UPI001AE3346B|nr:sulfatase [Neorhizobium galegae]MBP2550631.1 hypothetical protein [Neorhizobium galegae]